MVSFTEEEKAEQKKRLIKKIFLSLAGLVGAVASGALMFVPGASELFVAGALVVSCSSLAVTTTYGVRALRQIVNSSKDKKAEKNANVSNVSVKEIQEIKDIEYKNPYNYVSKVTKKKKSLKNISNEEFEEMLIES